MPSSLFAEFKITAHRKISEIQADDFSHLVQRNFKLSLPNKKNYLIKLESITEHHRCTSLPTHVRTGFTLNWSMDETTEINDGIYTLIHPDHGKMELYFDYKGHQNGKIILESCWS